MANNEQMVIAYLDGVAEAIRTGGIIADGTNFAEGDCVVLDFRLGRGPTRRLVVAYQNVPAVIAVLRGSARLLTVIAFEPTWLADVSVVSRLIDVA